jgi:dolichol-phosphate mannosyltransferase
MAKQYDLALIMPVYNEAECIESVVQDWDRTLSKLGMSYVLLVFSDGSKDETEAVLSRFAGRVKVRVVTQTNAGHGPTIFGG